MEPRRLHVGLLTLLLGWALASAAWAAPAKSQKNTDKGGALVAFKDIPTLPEGPDHDCYATISRKAYDVRILARNLVVYIYPKDKGERIDKPIEINSFAVNTNTPGYANAVVFDGVRDLAPPLSNATKLVITAVSADEIVLTQTWKFGDNKVEMEEKVAGLPTEDTPTVLTLVRWPMTHKFTPNVEQADREQAVAGYTFRWHAGRSAGAMKTITCPYALPVVHQAAGDWAENQGPWGAHKVTLKRKGNKGNLTWGVYASCPYEGLEMVFVPQCNAGSKKIETHGLEIKID
jgi:hypothetical protein